MMKIFIAIKIFYIMFNELLLQLFYSQYNKFILKLKNVFFLY